jgi:hypothetical protein
MVVVHLQVAPWGQFAAAEAGPANEMADAAKAAKARRRVYWDFMFMAVSRLAGR